MGYKAHIQFLNATCRVPTSMGAILWNVGG